MSFVKLQLGPNEVVLGTITKKLVAISVGPAAVRALGWSEDEPNLSVGVGDGDDRGWVRIFLDEEGSTPEEVDDRLVVTVPRSAVPDLSDCRASPLTWRPAEGGIDVRLPTVAATAVRPALRDVSSPHGRSANRPVIEKEEDGLPRVIGPPALYAQLHRNAWAAGIEVHFLDDGNCVVAGQVIDVDEVERAVRRAAEKKSNDLSRSSAA